MTRVITPITHSKLENTNYLKHGFFTKIGGISKELFESLHINSNNTKEVLQNKKIISNHFDTEFLFLPKIIHSSKVIILDSIHKITQFKNSIPEGDAVVTNMQNILIGITTADCVPILFADQNKKIIAATHAGWQGALGEVLKNTIQAMEKLGSNRDNIIAIIGPCIRQQSYEVAVSFKNNFLEQDQHNTKFFINSTKPNHYMFDLAGYVRKKLENSNILNINDVNLDTYTEADLFFSYRRACHKTNGICGRQFSGIMIL